MKQYECDVITRQRVVVEANSDNEARRTAMQQHETMTGIPNKAVQQVKVMEIVQPTAIFGSRKRGAIQ